MAASSQAIPAVDLTRRAAEKPLLVGRNLLDIAYRQAVAQLVYNQTGTLAAGDLSPADFPIRRLQNRIRNGLWKGTAGTDHYLVLDTGTELEWADALVIDGHNWGGKTVTVEADSTTPAVPWTGATTVVNALAVSGTSLVLNLQAANMYQARYWRIHISGTSFTPQAKQVWIGKALQLSAKSDRDWAPPAAGAAEMARARTMGGHAYTYDFTGPLEQREQTFSIAEAWSETEGTVIGDLVELWNAANGLDGGTRPFYYCEDPTSEPEKARLLYSEDADLELLQVGPYKTRWTLRTIEQGGRT